MKNKYNVINVTGYVSFITGSVLLGISSILYVDFFEAINSGKNSNVTKQAKIKKY